jgi:hypothetical protein
LTAGRYDNPVKPQRALGKRLTSRKKHSRGVSGPLRTWHRRSFVAFSELSVWGGGRIGARWIKKRPYRSLPKRTVKPTTRSQGKRGEKEEIPKSWPEAEAEEGTQVWRRPAVSLGWIPKRPDHSKNIEKIKGFIYVR